MEDLQLNKSQFGIEFGAYVKGNNFTKYLLFYLYYKKFIFFPSIYYRVRSDITSSQHLRNLIKNWVEKRSSSSGGKSVESLESDLILDEMFDIKPDDNDDSGKTKVWVNEIEKVKILRLIQDDFDSLYDEDKTFKSEPNEEQAVVWDRVYELCQR